MADLLRVDSLEKIYGSGAEATYALRGVSFDVNEGEFAAIVGQSGSGKSTLLNMIGLLDTPSNGSVSIRGTDVCSVSKDRRAQLRNELIGFVFQFHYLLPEFTVFENVAMPAWISSTQAPGDAPGPKEIRRRAEESLSLLGLDGYADKNANQLSGGQKQRVAIARALMNRPALVLADEPTGNLDTVNTNLVYDLFRSINEQTGTAFLIVTHDRAVAQRADRVLEVCDGHLVQDLRNRFS